MSNGAEGLSTSTGTRVDLGNPALNEDISAGMTRVEELLQKELCVGEDFIVEKVKHLANAGGKRFRPMFALLASQYGDHPVSEDVIKAAVVVEMTHLATLYHDDVMDEAAKRRGVESANARWNNSVAILAGDILLAHVSRLMADLGTDTVRHFSETFGDLVTGQMRETIGMGEGDPIEHYMAVIREKTGVLIASAGYLGALHSGATADHIEALRAYGAAIGMVFQIVDDIIDIFSDSEDSGKTPGTDLREGVFTLPVLYALREQTPIGEELRATLTGPVTDDTTVARVLDLLTQSTGRDRALADVHHYLNEAEAQLELLPQNATTEALHNLARFTVQRVG
ncbi:polyprenyl synthetase family protein [Corynebacterium pseudotuberculosis 258]|uniref:Polyprenyl synthetase family protein n=1 Tax=Corynebacterium pseudotuberculosis 258 TaxID=1168865 RepID=A0AAU8PK42_CORPS|nr:polyprenyl synthetase family protein [Corynebacterium pseudotuberculosis]AEQ05869.1 polyprenyl synthetase family protein [Corynebacterium pseudotuberculosis CIP 52.97]AFK15953.1 polyprenyl synthetase family protein [Corynebacterium pseudotuberculosis 258]